MKTLSSEQFYTKHYDYYDSLRNGRLDYIHAINSYIIDNYESGSILDIGCGDGLRSLELKNKICVDFVGLDNCAEMCERARINGMQTIINESIENLSQQTINKYKGFFGSILCLWNVLGHITIMKDRQKAIKNMSTLLDSEGMLFIDVNNRFNIAQYGICNFLRNSIIEMARRNKGIFSIPINDEKSKVYISSKKELSNLLDGSGFTIEHLFYINYKNGVTEKDQFRGQLFAICRKKKI
ncbi:MAG TPA: class I SAM-dependent methyltransferase [Candidatus Moranbacteria bacterium]|nr:class I SAM-dependent methyltransferase [Candidatus Moranbacteria bacterium]HSA08424.1 class I SAM-dependent methyltransferase [Candidatus Moranbacteria bacterium]